MNTQLQERLKARSAKKIRGHKNRMKTSAKKEDVCTRYLGLTHTLTHNAVYIHISRLNRKVK